MSENTNSEVMDALRMVFTKVSEVGSKIDKVNTYLEEEEKKKNEVKYLNNEFFELNGLDTFVKLKATSFGIGKLLFAFVQFDKNTKKLKTSMDVYMDMDKALLFANDVLSGRIGALAQAERAKGAQYPGDVWKSPLGGISEEKAKIKGLRTDGKAISRMFTLAPGSRQPFVFTAEQRPGKTDDKGLIVPEYSGKPEVQIRVPSSEDDLKMLAIAIESNINAFRTAQYSNKEFDVAPTPKK